MNKLAVIAILVIMVFLVGCAAKEISVAGESREPASSGGASASDSKTSTATKTAASTKTAANTAAPEEDEETGGGIVIKDSSTGQTSTFKSLGDPWRDKEATEHCNLKFPFECSKYLANAGIVYITIKNQDYSSVARELTLTLDGERCDPSDTFIEPGQNKEFQCFVDPGVSGVSGELVINYFVPMTSSHRIAEGSIAVRME